MSLAACIAASVKGLPSQAAQIKSEPHLETCAHAIQRGTPIGTERQPQLVAQDGKNSCALVLRKPPSEDADSAAVL